MLSYHAQSGETKIDLILEKISQGKNIALVTDAGTPGISDPGSLLISRIRNDFPDRFLNCGASEQAMMAMAVGLALEGKKPFVYSITTFLLLRPFEVIRTYINHEKIPVRLVGSGRDKDYIHDGISHWSEDIFKFFCNEGDGIFGNITAYWPQQKEDIPDVVKKMIKINQPSFISLRR